MASTTVRTDSESWINAAATAEMTYTLPAPPRIQIPPPTVSSEGQQKYKLFTRPTPDQVPLQLDFLRAISLDEVIDGNKLLDWHYERRWEPQMVLPWLYIGPMTAAKDRQFLRTKDITMVLAIQQWKTTSLGAFKVASELGITKEAINVHSSQELVACFPQAASIINRHLMDYFVATSRIGRILVFCESGNERSAAVVAAYIMETLDDCDFIAAMHLCQSQRFAVSFDDTAKRLLQSYWDVIQAKRDLVAAQVSFGTGQGGSVPSRHKRVLSESEDIAMDVEGTFPSNDRERFQGRNFRPFLD